ncbi:Dolichyl-diphosphooligosaccharide-protein glycosyltransferase subunit dad1 [Cryomyces antarcticus]|nr:Dolichyl-diphosphooligosaccharide-protein glycosyltransferase subunit dad1 [Cryomyces antarcticus]
MVSLLVSSLGHEAAKRDISARQDATLTDGPRINTHPHPASSMSNSTSRPPATGSIDGALVEKSCFEQQREALVADVATSLEHVLQNINKLNRSLEGVIAVGNEFGSVEALWSQFENVMARDFEAEGLGRDQEDAREGSGTQEKS